MTRTGGTPKARAGIAPSSPQAPDPTGADWQVWTPGRYQLAEGLRPHRGGMVFVDLLKGDLYRCADTPGRAPDRLLGLGVPLGAVAPVSGGGNSDGDDGDSEWIVAAGTGIALVTEGGRPRWLDRPEAHAKLPMRMNDGVCDPAGRFWAGSMALGGDAPVGSLYRVDHDGTVHRVLYGLAVPNGPAFSPCGSLMYLADSAEGTVLRYPVDPRTGALGAPSLLARFTAAEGRPDGMTVDDEGLLWLALWGAGQVRCHTPDGVRVQTLDLPTPHTSSVAFGAGRMYVTTARHRLTVPDPLAGAVFARASPTTSPPARPFGPSPGQRGPYSDGHVPSYLEFMRRNL
ncbi:SMP-30/gluconolactonase/LRE family protein [Streptomyces sp. NBC_00304]|uniref:SMP-30/gluconolactonase/LRE family protein n=1 Tax=Streptomyces sp. NBC_00304 TaxID=2975706 RepID=UPI002E2C1E48|nr:SMP-30/gluconolactonase/LRE family protein [Streptomyces sp. NBC_00304]